MLSILSPGDAYKALVVQFESILSCAFNRIFPTKVTGAIMFGDFTKDQLTAILMFDE